jgi:hypothetical protein
MLHPQIHLENHYHYSSSGFASLLDHPNKHLGKTRGVLLLKGLSVLKGLDLEIDE